MLAVVWQIFLPLTKTRYPVVCDVDDVHPIELLLIDVGEKLFAMGGAGFTTTLLSTTVSTPSTVPTTGTTRTPVKPLTGVTAIPVAVTLILARDLNSSSTVLDKEMLLAETLRLADWEELIVSVLVLIDAPVF